ncbi:MAG: protein-tyrosine-phosphatase [Planctomycetota bacterium]|nr:protein-tyrosine-phosphatase [Planctomycetota bacterium]
MLPALADYLNSRDSELERITEHRRTLLRPLAESLARRLRRPGAVRTTFICTHNSRRSHIAQLFLEAAARRRGLDLATFSGGTEATALAPPAAAALARAGFRFRASPAAGDSGFDVDLEDNGGSLRCFSKIHHDSPNPTTDFVAVMVCDDADRGCPIVPGADARFAIPYRDPKVADDTPRESEMYDERCREIAREMIWLADEIIRSC